MQQQPEMGENQSESDMLEGSSSNADSPLQHQYFRTSVIAYVLCEKQPCAKQRDQGNTSTTYSPWVCICPRYWEKGSHYQQLSEPSLFDCKEFIFQIKQNEPFHFPWMNRICFLLNLFYQFHFRTHRYLISDFSFPPIIPSQHPHLFSNNLTFSYEVS